MKIRSGVPEVLAARWWAGELGDVPGAGTVSIPVGAGRRRFVLTAFEHVLRQHAAARLLLVVADDEIAALWRDGLRSRPAWLHDSKEDSASGERIVVVPASPAPRSAGWTEDDLLILDEPTRIPPEVRIEIDRIPIRYRIDLHTTAPHRSAGPPSKRLSTLERDIGRVVAGLIDGELDRRSPMGVFRWTAYHARLDPDAITGLGLPHSGVHFTFAGLAIARLLEKGLASATAAADVEKDPEWTEIEHPGGSVAIPSSILAAFPAGAVAPFGLAIGVDDRGPGLKPVVNVFCERGRREQAAAVVRDLVAEIRRSPDNPYRGATLEVTDTAEGLDVRVSTVPPSDRKDVILPDEIWQELDRNIHGLFAKRDILERLGLGLDRGILLYGPPGTGKTAIVRVLASELAGQATTLFVDPSAMQTRLNAVYEIGRDLAPSLVVLEDVDLIVAARGGGPSQPLVDFLGAVDGAMTSHTGVVTIATTNAPGAIDEAAKRAARFDRLIEVGPPSLEARRLIWRRYLHGTELSSEEIGRLASRSSGSTGADIREIVRHAVLDSEGALAMDDIVTAIRRHDRSSRDRRGQYL